MSDRFENDHEAHPDWISESRTCPFCTVPAMKCGCPEGERIVEAHLVLGEN